MYKYYSVILFIIIHINERNCINIGNINSSFPDNKLSVDVDLQFFKSINDDNVTVLLYMLKDHDNCLGYTKISANKTIEDTSILMKMKSCQYSIDQVLTKIPEKFQLNFSDSINIEPYTKYDIYVEALVNGVWNDKIVSFKTNQYKSGAAIYVPDSLESNYPNNKFKISWKSPNKPNGLIDGYILALYKGSTCFRYWFISCNKNMPYNNINKDQIHSILPSCNLTAIFKYRDGLIDCHLVHFTTNDPLTPFTNYTVVVHAHNNWGYGEPMKVSFRSGSYISNSVKSLSVSNSNKLCQLQVSWIKPNRTNGIITQYSILIKENDRCLIEFIVKLSNKIGGINNQIKHCDREQYLKQNEWYRNGSTYNAYLNGSSMELLISYDVYVIPRNTWGWGNSISQSILYCNNGINSLSQLEASYNSQESQIKVQWHNNKNNALFFVLFLRCRFQTTHVHVIYFQEDFKDYEEIVNKKISNFNHITKQYQQNSNTGFHIYQIDKLIIKDEEFPCHIYVGPRHHNEWGQFQNTKLIIMKNTEKKTISPEYQIILTIPLSEYKSEWSNIRQLTIVVAQKPIEIFNHIDVNREFLYPAYEECHRPDHECVYEVLVYPERSQSNEELIHKFQDFNFTIGIHETCAGLIKYDCNGYLESTTEYKFYLGVYRGNSVNLRYLNSKNTNGYLPRSNWLTITIVTIIILISTVLVVFIIIICKNQYNGEIKYRKEDFKHLVEFEEVPMEFMPK